MPLYRYGCPECGTERDEFRQVAERHDSPVCHGRMSIVICPSQVVADLPGYVSPVSGQWVEGRAARREDLQRSGSRPYEGFAAEKKEADRRKQEAETKLEHGLEVAARKALSELPPAKRRVLEESP